jgi:hypothetical protein
MLLVAVGAGACGSEVIGGGDDGGGGATGGSPAAGPAGGSEQPSAIAMFGGEWSGALPCGDAGQCATDATLFLVADAAGVTCSDQDVAPGSSWSFVIALPASLQQAGTYDLEARDEIYVTTGQTDGAEESGMVSATVGFGPSTGSIEILELGPTSVRFRVTGVNLGGRSDGEYTALRCGASSWA